MKQPTKNVFDALRQVQQDCNIRAEEAEAADDKNRAEDWRYMAVRIARTLEQCSHLED